MKKKQNAKERRQEVSMQKHNSIADINARKAEQERQLALKQAQQAEAKRKAALEVTVQAYLQENPIERNKKKSGPKAAGVKSLFQIQDSEMLMTSFGRGNDAILEKAVHDGIIEDLQEKPAFSAEKCPSGYLVSGRMTHNALLDEPFRMQKAAESTPDSTARKPGDDLIGLRRQFEQSFFGQTFEDNIHIQVIYNILDIEKILAVHINNIIYEINNLLRKDGFQFSDLFQSLNAETKYSKFVEKSNNSFVLFEQLMSTPRRAYFGDVLYRPVKAKNRNQAAALEQAERERCYYLLGLLGLTRHSLAHGLEKQRCAIYQLDVNSKLQPALEQLNQLYAERVQAINKDFLEHARQKNLPLLYAALGVTDQQRKEELARDYYDFTVRKEYKNQGFSLTTLREIILTLPDAAVLKAQEYDSVRSKLYMLFDFVVFDWYRRHQDRADALVNHLRGAIMEEDKVRFYMDEADVLWRDIKPAVMDHIAAMLREDRIQDIRPITMDEHVLQGIALDTKVSSFSKLMYLIACFQDGKEINDLLTTLINKFENIASFLCVLNERGLPCTFARPYQMFSNSQCIARELRTINSFARMGKAEAITKREMFYDAARVLGFTESQEKLEPIIDQMLDKESGELLPNGKKNNGFRNFIINNVLESRRFQYLVRYGNTETLHKLAQNAVVVAFVLKDIPDKQIVRYYNSCFAENAEYSPNMREKLQQKIAEVNFTNFSLIKTNKAYATAEENIQKERQKAIVRLYLTVLYLLVKNLVYVNSRYFLAFHCVERDAVTYDSKKYKDLGKTDGRDNLSDFARERVESGCLNKRATRYVLQNFANSDKIMIAAFRNYAAHLSVVRNADRYVGELSHVDSYFELYHYLLQRYLLDDYRRMDTKGDEHINHNTVNSKTLEYFALVEKHHSYCKDMVKALNVPFAYNLPRYKNLSIADLFDRNHYLPHEAEKDAEKTEG